MQHYDLSTDSRPCWAAHWHQGSVCTFITDGRRRRGGWSVTSTQHALSVYSFEKHAWHWQHSWQKPVSSYPRGGGEEGGVVITCCLGGAVQHFSDGHDRKENITWMLLIHLNTSELLLRNPKHARVHTSNAGVVTHTHDTLSWLETSVHSCILSCFTKLFSTCWDAKHDFSDTGKMLHLSPGELTGRSVGFTQVCCWGGSFLPEFQVAHELLHGHVVQKHKVGFPILQALVLCHDAGVSWPSDEV